MVMAFKPNGIEFNGVLLRSDTAAGNLNFYKGMEGFLESFPQAIYQISISLRSAGKIGMNTFNAHFISNHKSNNISKIIYVYFVFTQFVSNFRYQPTPFHLNVTIHIKYDLRLFPVPPTSTIHYLRQKN